MANRTPGTETARHALAVTTALMVMFAWCGSASAAFYINCAGCHTVPQNGMAIVNFQATTNLGNGLRKVFKVSPGQTAVIQLNVTNNYGGGYALNLNNLDAGGVNNTSDHLAYTADPAWTHYFPGTTTNFFMAGCATKSPDLWTFNLVVKTNTPPDFYTVNSQMAGYYSSTMWSQQESFYVQVVAAAPPVPVLQAPRRSGYSFSVQVATTSGFTYYLEYKTNLTAPTWNAASRTPGNGTIKTLTDTTATDSSRFYQAHVQ
ncbi:MAG: hypothetical protein ABSH34_28255 [Verrucomicrobiota bacterium]